MPWKNSMKTTSRRIKRGNFGRAEQRQRSRRNLAAAVEQLEGRAMLSGMTFEVTNLQDSGAGSLRQAIIDANANPGGDTIRFRGVQGTIPLDSQLLITDDLTIRGPGAHKIRVSGQGQTRVFAVIPASLESNPNSTPTLADVSSTPTVKIERLTIEQGLAIDAPGYDPVVPDFSVFGFGGGVYNLGGQLTLERVVLADNSAGNGLSAGGAVANEFGGTLNVIHSHFEANASLGFAVAVGGAITSDSGAAADGVTGQPEVTVEHSTFVGNTAATQIGTVAGQAFTGVAGGGAILNVTGALTVSHSQFAENTAVGGTGVAINTTAGVALGGAILSGNVSPFTMAQSTLNISHSTFEANHAVGGDSSAANVPGGQASGGAIATGNGNLASLQRNKFFENSATGGHGGPDAGGGIASGGAISVSGGAALTLERNRIRGNRADGGDGAGTGANATGRGGGLALESIGVDGFLPGTPTAASSRDRFEQNTALGGIGGGIYNEGELSLDKARVTDNEAVGQAGVLIDFVLGYEFQGGALGGGVSSLGPVEVVDSLFEDNVAVGADGGSGGNVIALGETPSYPGLGVGGGLHTLLEATVEGSRFVGNEARGGDNNSGSFAGVANGGGIYNDGSIVLYRSRLQDNQALGGDDNTGDINAGGGYGGGLSSGSVTALGALRSASLEVDRSTIQGNAAIGGDGNSSILVAVPLAHAPGGGTGGGMLVYQGTASIDHSSITRNRAIGGEGGLGAGGGAFFFSFIGSVEAELSGSIVANNLARGGELADGLGGGIAAGSLGSFFGAFGELDVNRSLVRGNRAQGGAGGNGLGGGIYNAAGASLDLSATLMMKNRARGGSGGMGVGGGVYNLGDVDLFFTWIFANFASSSASNCFGC